MEKIFSDGRSFVPPVDLPRLTSRGRVSSGRVVLPAELRKVLGIEDGSEVIFSRTEYGIEMKTLAAVVREAQERCARYLQPATSVVDDLIRDRREAADRE